MSFLLQRARPTSASLPPIGRRVLLIPLLRDTMGIMLVPALARPRVAICRRLLESIIHHTLPAVIFNWLSFGMEQGGINHLGRKDSIMQWHA